MAHRVTIANMGLFYSESKDWHLYLQACDAGEGQLDFLFVLARDDQEALEQGGKEHRIIFSMRVLAMLQALAKRMPIDTEVKVY